MKTLAFRVLISGLLFHIQTFASPLLPTAPSLPPVSSPSSLLTVELKGLNLGSVEDPKNDVETKTVEIKLESAKKATVVVFLSVNCPCSRGHEEALKKLANQFKDPDFQFVGIHSNADEGVEKSRAYFKQAALPFPVLQDEGAKIAIHLEAVKTPHAYVLDPSGKILFQGGVDDSHYSRTADKKYLEDALTSIKKGESVSKSFVRVLGCAIKRP